MNAESILYVLKQTRDLLRSGGDLHDYQNNLVRLAPVVTSTSTSESTRRAIGSDPAVLDLSMDILRHSFDYKPDCGDKEHLYVRNVRGVVLIVRNLLTSSTVQFDPLNLTSGLNNLISTIKSSNSYYSLCLQAYFEAFSNFLTKSTHQSSSLFSSLADAIGERTVRYVIEINQVALQSPLNLIIDAFLVYTREDPLILVDNSYVHFANYIINQGLDQMHDNSFPRDLLSPLQKIITHQGFKLWLENRYEETSLESILNLCQLVISSRDDWSPKELQAIIHWDFQIYRISMMHALKFLSPETMFTTLPAVHSKLVRSLDIITTICHQEDVLAFLNDNLALQSFITLLRAVQENTEIKTKKTPKSQSNSEESSKKSFPLVKSLIIEIMASLCHNSFANQEAMRELHGLELVLSNCLIDENNPYVKEYALLYLKYVLSRNQKNQDFVASLEAKQVVSSDVLSQAGYEISIQDGNVNVKTSNKPQ